MTAPGQAAYVPRESLWALVQAWAAKADEPDRDPYSAAAYRIAKANLVDTIAAAAPALAAPGELDGAMVECGAAHCPPSMHTDCEWSKCATVITPQPEPAPDLAALRELRGVVDNFADVWAELMVALPDDYGCEMNCTEANAAADLYRALGFDRTARDIIAAHVATDDDEERASHNEPTGGAT